jgi:hypothetical protein
MIAEENNKLENLMTLSLNEIPKFPEQYNNKKKLINSNFTVNSTKIKLLHIRPIKEYSLYA